MIMLVSDFAGLRGIEGQTPRAAGLGAPFGRHLPMTEIKPFAIRPAEAGTRRNQLIEPQSGVIHAEVEDDFHHFWMEIAHDGVEVIGIRTGAVRQPWSTCDAAGIFLAERMKGQRLDALAAVDNALAHCTHQHDLVLLAAAHAADDAPLLYSSFASDRTRPTRTAELYRNGEPLLQWEVEPSGVIASGEAQGLSLRKLKDWEGALAPAEREAARVLRRTIFIAGGREFDYSATPTADRIRGSAGACYTFQPERSAGSRLTMSRRDFSHGDVPLRGRLEELASTSRGL